MLSDSISDRTIALLFPSNLLVLTQPSNVSTFSNQRYKSTMQMCRRICAPPEMNIRIFNPLSSFLLFNDSMMQIDLWKKSECFSDHKLAALTFGSYILCCRIFPSNLLALTQPSNVSTFSNQRYKSTMQMCRRICAPPEMNIRIFNPLSSFLLFNDSMMQIDV